MQPRVPSLPSGVAQDAPAAWGPVFALALAAFALVASEFMPVSLLSPIASDLRISEGQAGQAIGVSGAFFAIVPVAALAFAWMFVSLPALPAASDARSGSAAIVAVLLAVWGQRATFGVAALLLVVAAALARKAARA